MKRVFDLLNEVVEMGFQREKALRDIDFSLDAEFGCENRLDLAIEVISDDMYNAILEGFGEEKEAREGVI